MPTLKTKYQEEVAPALMSKFGYKSPMQIPQSGQDRCQRRLLRGS